MKRKLIISLCAFLSISQVMLAQNISDWFVEGGLHLISSSTADYYCIDTDTLIDVDPTYIIGTDPIAWGYTVNRASMDTADFEILVTAYDVYNGAAAGVGKFDSIAAIAFNYDSTMDIGTTFYEDLANNVSLQINFYEYGSRTNAAFDPGSGGTSKQMIIGLTAPNYNHGVGRLHAAELYRIDNLSSSATQTYFISDICSQVDVFALPSDTLDFDGEDISGSWLATQEGSSAYPYNLSNDVVFFHTMEAQNTCDANSDNKLQTSEASYNLLFTFSNSFAISRQDISKLALLKTGQLSSIGVFVDSIAFVAAIKVLDIDADDDGIPDTIESGGNDPDGDEDGDGTPNYLDTSDAGDSGDGSTTNYIDSDSNGIPDVYDTDGDGISNHLDLDSDNDGIPDIIEAGGVDTDGNGIVDNVESDGTLTNDTNGDGLDDLYDANNGGIAILNNDTDGDGLTDPYDLDADNDGIPDIIEAGGIDTDGDGRVDVDVSNIANDADSDGYADVYDSDDDGSFGIDAGEATAPLALSIDTDSDGRYDAITDGGGTSIDSDSDGYADFIDRDADNDGISDIIEVGGIDNGGDGKVDTETDADGDGLADIYDSDASDGPSGSGTNGSALIQTNGTDDNGDYKANDSNIVWEHGNGIDIDIDGDGLPEYIDVDADNDGIPDIIESGGQDSDGDGRVDAGNATDTDQDGFADAYDANADDGPGPSGTNGNPLIQTNGTDTGSDGIAHNDSGVGYENGSSSGLPDLDGDKIPNYLDLDADNDGILDVVETGATDSDRDGIADGTTDADGDGLLDTYDPDASDGPAGSGTDGTALMTAGSDDGDADSRHEYVGGSGTADSDGDDVPDFLDVDADNDGIFDVYEAQATIGYIAPAGTDADGDGIDDNFDDDDGNRGGAGAAGITPVNTESTGNQDYLDLDTDDDGVPDMQEVWDSLADGDSQPDGVSGSCTSDTDGDGLVDCFDSNDADINVYTISITPPSDDGAGGSSGGTSDGVDITASNDLDDVFPANNLNGSSNNNEPDFRDIDNANCAASIVWYAITDGDTTNDYHWVSGSGLHTVGSNTAVVRATAFCEKSTWYRFYNPLQSDRYILSVQNGTNTVPLENVIDYVEVQTVPAPVRNDNGTDGMVLMQRSWFIATKGSLNGTVNIRFYYPKSEWDALKDSATTLASDVNGNVDYTWYKSDVTVDYSSVPSQFSGLGNNYLQLTASVSSENAGSGDTEAGGNAKNYVQIDDLTSFSGGTFGSESSTVLPVELLEFTATIQESHNHLVWTTAKEINSDYYQIERSLDGQNFEKIAQLKAAGQSDESKTYQYDDLAELDVNRVLYRLRMVDQDGKFQLSNVIELELKGRQDFRIFPNPAKDFIQFSFQIEDREKVEIQIFDLSGKEVLRKKITGNDNLQYFELDIQHLPVGIYQISLKTKYSRMIRKFVKE